ncbi:hypothetical protein [Phyllobacterium calauticae]|jgi:Mg/Co/Ni transporter MgtE|uniref:hypothetical protein n=1 Tax=Phyllobacterium calauticae TaxID=2817027 RepID=UPI001CBB09B2|nr:hypothetical protein [Phyllobacterium calauticae]MBZ3696024.1 hypothetical protein [Phyllobacterium calauticae]
MSERIQIDPMVVVNEQRELIGFYENRNLLLANENQKLREGLEQANASIARLTEDLANLSPEEPAKVEKKGKAN